MPNFFVEAEGLEPPSQSAAVLPETKYLLLLTYIPCKRFLLSTAVFANSTILQCFSKNFFLRRRKDSNFHGLIHGQFITPDRSTLLCLPLHHILHVFEHLVGFEPTKRGFADPCLRPLDHRCIFARLDWFRTSVS